MQSYYSCQSGRSMVEILGVLAVIGVLSVGGIAAYSKAMEKINTDQLIVDISTTARKIKNLYADQKSYEDLDQQVYTLNLVAGAHKIEGMNKKLLHIFNGEVFVKSIALNKGFVMVYNGLTEKACATLASTDWGNGSNLDSGEYEAKDIPLSPAEAAAHCNCDAFYKCGIAWFYE